MIITVSIIRRYKLDCDYRGNLNKNRGKKVVLYVEIKPTFLFDNNPCRLACAERGAQAIP
jgi:hypothetical protein